MTNESSRGPEVPPHEDLLRVILHPYWWDPKDCHVSSAIFGFPKFSAFIASMTTEEALLKRFRSGSGMLKFNCGVARRHGFDAHHEPEQDDNAHANVYRINKSKKHARELLRETSTIITVKPDIERLRGLT